MIRGGHEPHLPGPLHLLVIKVPRVHIRQHEARDVIGFVPAAAQQGSARMVIAQRAPSSLPPHLTRSRYSSALSGGPAAIRRAMSSSS